MRNYIFLLKPGGRADIHVPAGDVESFWALLEENEIDFGIMTHNLQHDIGISNFQRSGADKLKFSRRRKRRNDKKRPSSLLDKL